MQAAHKPLSVEYHEHDNTMSQSSAADPTSDIVLFLQEHFGIPDINTPITFTIPNISNSKLHEDDKVKIFCQELAQHQNQYGNLHNTTLHTAHDLLVKCLGRRFLSTASILCQQIIQNRFVLAAEHDRETLVSLINLSNLLRLQSHFKKAETLCRLVYVKSQICLSSTDTAHFLIRNELAACYHDLGSYVRAEELFRENIRQGSSILPNNHSLVFAMQQMADLLKLRGEFAEAEQIARSILVALLLDRDQLDIAVLEARSLVAELMYLQDNAEAETLIRSVLEDCEKALGSEHSLTLRTLKCLSMELLHQHRYDEAMLLLEGAVRESRNRNGSDYWQTVRFEITLAKILIRREQFNEAESLLKKVLTLSQEDPDDHQEEVDRASLSLGKCYHGQGRLEEAAAIFEKTLQRAKERYHPKHLRIRRCASALAEVQQDMQELDHSMLLNHDSSSADTSNDEAGMES